MRFADVVDEDSDIVAFGDGGLERGVVFGRGGGEVYCDGSYAERGVAGLQGGLERGEFRGGPRGEEEVVVCPGEGVRVV